MRKCLFLLTSCLIITSQIKAQKTVSVWTKKYEQGIYDQYYSLAKDKINDEFTRQQFSLCCVEKTKELLPNGIESVSNDDLNKISSKIINSCATEIKDKLIFKKWTPEIEKYLKEMFVNNDSTLNISYRTQMGNCMVEKLKIIYPDGLNGSVPDDVAVDLSKSCARELMKALQWTPELEASLKESFANAPQIRRLKPAVREAVCNCYISKTKKLYPNGLPDGKVSKEASIKILQQCPLKKIQQSLE